MRQVTHDLGIKYGITNLADLRRWNSLILELEKKEHTLESIKKTDVFFDLTTDFVISDNLLRQLIKIHLDFHEF